ncbi:hypothetical protein L218DRAFT_985672 [Marasmius fiardii PR-910]|nr:hypothetical protein L218DRAFT_985672 [Marasmius fiardii PR-910]
MRIMPLDHLERREILPGDEFSKRETPEIGGSSAGFIALVVCLVVIIVVSCTAIFFLLKHNDPSDAERAARRQRRYAHQSLPSSSSYTYDPSSSPHKGWLSKVTDIFNKKTSTSSKSRKNINRGDGLKLGGSSAGWVQAGSGDEWDTEISGDEGDGRRSRTRDMVTAAGPSPLATPNPYSRGIDSPFTPPRESISSSYLDSHPIAGLESYDHRSSSTPPLPPGAQSPSSPMTITTIGDVSPFPTNAISHQRSFSPEQISTLPVDSPTHQNKNDNSLDTVNTRKWSVQSDVSARTGTKFIEEL